MLVIVIGFIVMLLMEVWGVLKVFVNNSKMLSLKYFSKTYIHTYIYYILKKIGGFKKILGFLQIKKKILGWHFCYSDYTFNQIFINNIILLINIFLLYLLYYCCHWKIQNMVCWVCYIWKSKISILIIYYLYKKIYI